MSVPSRPFALALLLTVATTALAGCGSRQTPIGELTSEQLWERGVTAFNDEDWDDAIRYFDRYALVGGSDPRIVQARFYVAEARFRMREYVTAASEFTRLAADLGRGDLGDDARFMACRAYEELSPRPQLDQEYTRAAVEHCRALVEYFPESEYADSATAIIDDMMDKLARKVYDAGDWYFGRRAYDSALIYFDEVAEQYPGTAWAPRALLKKFEIYTILEYEEEREEVREQLLRQYPESAAAARVRENDDSDVASRSR